MSSEAQAIGKSGNIEVAESPASSNAGTDPPSYQARSGQHGVPQVTNASALGGYASDSKAFDQLDGPGHPGAQPVTLMQHWKTARQGWLTYVRTKDFWIVLLLG